jgi:hypothetical protein
MPPDDSSAAASAPLRLTVVARANTTPRAVLTQRFRDAMAQGVAGIIAAGQVMVQGKVELLHGEFLAWVLTDLPLGKTGVRKAQMLMNLAQHPVLANAHHWCALPPSWRTLYELSLIRPHSRLLKLIADGTVNAGMTREDALALKPGKAQPSDGFIVSAAIAQLQRRFAQLSDAEAVSDLRAEPGILTPATLQQFAQRLATLAQLWEQ